MSIDLRRDLPVAGQYATPPIQSKTAKRSSTADNRNSCDITDQYRKESAGEPRLRSFSPPQAARTGTSDAAAPGSAPAPPDAGKARHKFPSWFDQEPIALLIRPQDRFDQGHIANQIRVKTEGLCVALSAQWLIDCLASNAPDPSTVLSTMKKNGPSYFKQLFQTQEAYLAQIAAEKKPNMLSRFFSRPSPQTIAARQSNDMQNVLKKMSKGRYGVLPSTQFYDHKSVGNFSSDILAGLEKSTTHPKSCLIALQCRDGGHLAAIVEDKDAGICRLFDPNNGILTFPKEKVETASIGLWLSNQAGSGHVIPLIDFDPPSAPAENSAGKRAPPAKPHTAAPNQ